MTFLGQLWLAGQERIGMQRWKVALVLAGLLTGGYAWAEPAGEADGRPAAEHSASAAAGAASEPDGGGAVQRAPVAAAPNPCELDELVAAPSRPVWTAGAATTQCGSLETDYGWYWQGLGGGARQTAAAMSIRYGITPWLDVRWGVPAYLTQGGGGTAALTGVSDQSLSLTWRFAEQRARLPAMALGYGFKIPTANPAKGFGSGYTDHQLAFIASRDVKKLHFDFNTVGTMAGGEGGTDGAAQYGLVLSAPATKRLTWMVETVGGSQPGTADRFGQALLGGQWSLRPWLVVDAAYTRAFTAGLPRQQFTMGWTWSSRPREVVVARQAITRLFSFRSHSRASSLLDPVRR
jgi:hypothetical protein